MKNLTQKISGITVFAILGLLFAANLIKPADALSYGERRHLAQFPKFTISKFMDATFMEEFGKYSTDQFLGRDTFRAVKAAFDRNVLRKLDTNGLFMVNEDVYKIEYPLKESTVTNLASRMSALQARYMEGMNVYLSLVPDKNYFLPDDGQYLLMDYNRIVALMREGMPNAAYIDLYGALEPADYYRTDGHWRQERLTNVVAVLTAGMGNTMTFNPSGYDAQSYDKFYGAYYGQSARALNPDTLTWLENDVTRAATAEYLGADGVMQTRMPLYNVDGLGGMDSYDLYLHGAQSLIVLTNPLADTDRELIIIRDSYSSSLAPVLLEGYAKITLVDLRYIRPELLGNFVEFNTQDVLFLLSTTIVNNGETIR